MDLTAFNDMVHWMRVEFLRSLPIQMPPELWYGPKSGLQLFLLRIFDMPRAGGGQRTRRRKQHREDEIRRKNRTNIGAENDTKVQKMTSEQKIQADACPRYLVQRTGACR